MEIEYEDAFREIEFIRENLRNPIKRMERYERYNYGDRIINLVLDIKISLKLASKGKNYVLDRDQLYNNLITLKVLIDECISNQSLLLKGKYNVIEPKKRLDKLLDMFP